MEETTRINLHCHSNLSDGELSPETLADRLAKAGVQYATLTDHDTLDGLERFHGVLKRRNVGFLSGVEITAQFRSREIHLLAYGFDTEHRELRATLQVLRHEKLARVQGPLRQMPSQFPPEPEGRPAPGVSETGSIDISEAIALVHRAGGRAFLAHPLTFEPDLKVLEGILEELKAMGLDGIEVTGGQHPATLQETLTDLACRQGVLTCAGTDFHAGSGPSQSALRIDLPTDSWKAFVRSISTTPDPASSPNVSGTPSKPEYDHVTETSPWPFFRPRIVLPSVLAIVLFITTIWGMILPSIESILVDRKRDTIRELTNTALSLLAEAEREERDGRITREEAQEKAKAYIGALRYGKEGKDYFWIQDMQPRMIMHPYRPDLNGRDVSGFTDPLGTQIFSRFAQIVRRQGKGFVEYVWQWKDDPERMAAKESYVSGFEPWEWVIGTGIYIDDVTAEIQRIEKNIVYTLTAIVALMFLVLIYNVRQSLGVEKKRAEMETSLREAEKRYRSLIEATTEGTLLVVGGRCRYGNPTLLQMAGLTPQRLELLTLPDLLPRQPENEALWAHMGRMAAEAAGTGSFEAVLQRTDGEQKECVVTLNPVTVADHPGIIVLVKDVLPSRMAAGSVRKLGQAAQTAAVGIFQTKASQRGTILAMNEAARKLMEAICTFGEDSPALADLFDDESEYDGVFKILRKNGGIENHMLQKITPDGEMRVLSLSATQAPGGPGEPPTIGCLVRDVTDTARRDSEREALIEKLGISLLFLQEPIGKLGGPVVTCHLETSIHRVATLMVARNTTCIVVETDEGAPVGFVTDHDFRKRVVGAGEMDPEAPVRTIMSAPLITISEKAMIYEALMRMEEARVQHLAVTDGEGRIGSVVRAMELLQFHRYGPAVLLREVERSEGPDKVQAACRRFPSLVKALVEAGAKPRIVAHMASAICDAATSRLIELAIEELGPPPASFSFIAMGSQGRQEQTLLTDQDNAIIYEQNEGADSKTTTAYFLSMGERVCGWLDGAGYALCNGDVMASNPKWCKSLPEWKEDFSDWMMKAESQELLDFSICLDFRSVFGKAQLAHELRSFIYGILNDRPSFLPHLAQNALLFKPPSRLLGKIIKGGGPEEAGKLNLKETMMPLVGFGRLYSLHHRMPHTHTMERIEALVWKGVLDSSVWEGVASAYDFLMRLRFQAQLAPMAEGRPLDNRIPLNKMEHLDEVMLKRAFVQIETLQKKIVYDFLGGAEWPGN